MVRFEWDDAKNHSNLAKHSIAFETAILVFEDPELLSEVERVIDGEERWQSIGMAGDVLLLLVAHTYVEDNEEEVIRVISARKATRRERAQYEASR